MATTMFRTHMPMNSEGISGRDLLSLADQTFLTTENYLENDGQWSQMSPASPMFPSPFGDMGFLTEGMDPFKSSRGINASNNPKAPKNKLPPSGEKNQPSLGQFFNKVKGGSNTARLPKRIQRSDEAEEPEEEGTETNSLALSAMTPPREMGFYNKRESTFDNSKQSLGLSALHSSIKTSDTTTTGKKISFAGFTNFHSSSKSDSTKRTKSTAASTKVSFGLSSLGTSRSSSQNSGDDRSIISKARNFNLNSVGEKFTNMLPDMKQRKDNSNTNQASHEEMLKDEKESLVKTLEKEHVAVRQENELLKAKLEESLVRYTQMAGMRHWFTVEELAVVMTEMSQVKLQKQRAHQDREDLEKTLEGFEAMAIEMEGCICDLEKSLSSKDDRIAALEAKLRQNGLSVAGGETVSKGMNTTTDRAEKVSNLNNSTNNDYSFAFEEMADDINSCLSGSTIMKTDVDDSKNDKGNEQSLEGALLKLESSDEAILKNLNVLADDLTETLSEFTKLSNEAESETRVKDQPAAEGMEENGENVGLRLDEYMANAKPTTTAVVNKMNQSKSTLETGTWAGDDFSTIPTPVSQEKSTVVSRSTLTRSKSSSRLRSKSPGQASLPSSSTRRRSKSPAAGRPRSKSPGAIRKQLKAVIDSESTESTPLAQSNAPQRRRLKSTTVSIGKGDKNYNATSQAGKQEGDRSKGRTPLCRSQSMIIQRVRDPPGTKEEHTMKPIGRCHSMGKTRSNSVGRASRRTQVAPKPNTESTSVVPPPPPPPPQSMSAKDRLRKTKKGSPSLASTKTRKTALKRSKSDDGLDMLARSAQNSKKDELRNSMHKAKKDELRSSTYKPKKDELRASTHKPKKDELRSSNHNPKQDELRSSNDKSKTDEGNKKKTTTADIKAELENVGTASEGGKSRKIKFTPKKKKSLPREG